MNAPATTTGPEIKPAEAAELRRRARACLDLAASSTHPAERDSAVTAADRLSARLIASGYPGVTGCPSEAARLSAQADAKAARRRASKAPQPPPEAGVLILASAATQATPPRHRPRPDLPIPAEPPRALRRWQAEAMPIVRRALGRMVTPEGETAARPLRPVVSAFMGAGKSVFLAELARLCAVKGFVVVVATPRQKLVRQLGETIAAFVPNTGLVMSGYRQTGAVIVACYASLEQTRAILAESGQKCDLLIVDECHGSEAPQHQQAMLALSPRWMVGVTATPFRSDEGERLSLWDEVVYRYSFADGLRDGVVTTITPIHWSADCEPFLPDPATDPDALPLEDGAPAVDDALIAMFKCHGLPGPTLTNAASIAEADGFAERLARHGFPAASIHSRLGWAEQSARIEALRAGRIAVLVHVSMLSEGADFPWLAALACRRRVSAKVRFVQEVGRVCRTNEGKTTGYVFDPMALMASFGLQHAEALGAAIDEADAEPDDEAADRKASNEDDEAGPPPRAVLLARVDAWALALIERLRQTSRLNAEDEKFLPWMIRELRKGGRAVPTGKQWSAIGRAVRSAGFDRYPCVPTRAALRRIVDQKALTKPQAAVLLTAVRWVAQNVSAFQPWPKDLPVPPPPA
jgi:hypothetical protein